MNSFKAFIKEKGLYLVCLALIFAATITSIWAIRNVVYGVGELTKSQQEKLNKEDTQWDLPDAKANTPVTDLPEGTPAPSAAPSVSSSSGGGSARSSAAQSGSAGTAASSAPQAALSSAPVDGEVLAPFSGNELVYSETLGDWRTHNGTDYAAKAGEAVSACVAGKVSAAYDDALWGGVVEITDKDERIWKYCGLEKPGPDVGAELAAGEVVGKLGSLPSESKGESHLHLECKKGAEWFDPAELLGTGK